VTDAITIQNPRNRGGSTGHVLAKRSVTFTEIRSVAMSLKDDVVASIVDLRLGHLQVATIETPRALEQLTNKQVL
ncbi:hypothetical protein, partial [Ectopseudomonas mendocina]